MKVNLKTKNNLELSSKEKDYITKKVLCLEDLFNHRHEVNANVLVSLYSNIYQVEVTIPTKHLILRAECKGDSLFAAIDMAADKIERQFLRHKDKVNSLIKKREGISNYYSREQAEPVQDLSKISKIKQVEATKMSVEDAILQLEMLDHDFYLFINEDNNKPTVVYLRKDGDYGTIELK